MAKSERTALTYEVNENGNIISERPLTRDAAFRKDFKGIVPYAHVLLFDDIGKILLPTRSEKHMYPYRRVPLTAGGFLTIKDTYEIDGKINIDYKGGAMEEFNEELRPQKELLSRAELNEVESLSGVYNLRKASGIEDIPLMYMKFFTAIYDENRIGELKPNMSEILDKEILDVDWFYPNKIRRNNIHETFGVEYGNRILEEGIEPHAKELRPSFFDNLIKMIFPQKKGGTSAASF
jgi:hypothetical protein